MRPRLIGHIIVLRMMDTRQIYGRPPRDVVDYWLNFADFDSNIGLACSVCFNAQFYEFYREH